MLQAALEAEVTEYVARYATLVDEQGRRTMVRNGQMPAREILSGAGPLTIVQPRVRDRRYTGVHTKFTSSILPPYMRRVPSLEEVIPVLYLKGVSTGDMGEALEALLGPQAKGLSAATIVRLKQNWEQEYAVWSQRGLRGKRYVYWWADGIYFNVRLAPERPCMLVIIGALEDGTKELVAVCDGLRESKAAWQEVLRDVKACGLEHSPALAIGDGSLGFWSALEEEFPGAAEQRCWVHKTANVLEKVPKSVQPAVKRLLHEMFLAPTRDKAEAAYRRCIAEYGAKYPKAMECLAKDYDVLFTFYEFPAEHWAHLRTTNPIESTFGTIRHRTRQTKGCGSRQATIMMVFKLATQAEAHWRRLNGNELITKVIQGQRCIDGVFAEAA
jgi:putative transposase